VLDYSDVSTKIQERCLDDNRIDLETKRASSSVRPTMNEHRADRANPATQFAARRANGLANAQLRTRMGENAKSTHKWPSSLARLSVGLSVFVLSSTNACTLHTLLSIMTIQWSNGPSGSGGRRIAVTENVVSRGERDAGMEIVTL